jgi:hypothetical protein
LGILEIAGSIDPANMTNTFLVLRFPVPLINLDDYQSPAFDDLHARFDQYQIYSLIWCDQLAEDSAQGLSAAVALPDLRYRSSLVVSAAPTDSADLTEPFGFAYADYRTNTLYVQGVEVWTKTYAAPDVIRGVLDQLVLTGSEFIPVTQESLDTRVRLMADGWVIAFTLPAQTTRTNSAQWIRYAEEYSYTADYRNRPANNEISITSSERETRQAVAFQSFSPIGLVPFDFAALAVRYPIRSPAQLTRVAEITSRLPPSHTERYALEKRRADYRDLISGNALDGRSLPRNVKAIATSTRKIRYGYYRRNRQETHPSLVTSLDWVFGELQVTKNKKYTLPLIDPVLGTLITDGKTNTELTGITHPSSYPARFLFPDQLGDLFDHWDTLYLAVPTIPPPAYPLANSQVITEAGAYYRPPDATTLIITTTYAPLVRVMAASNDRWGWGTLTAAKDRPSAEHQIFQFNHHALFDEIQPDGSYGKYMVDSPRLLEIHAALQADYYGSPVDGQLPAVNYRVLAEKIAALLGYRPEKMDGKHDVMKEKQHTRQFFNGDERNTEGQYGGNYFGDKGLLVRRLPNQFAKDGSIEHGGFVGVPDIPHLLKEVLDQLSIAIGGQESGAIEIKDGDATRRYPNQLELLKDMALATSSIHRLAHQQFVSSIVTQQQTGEIISGLGLPTVLKNTTVVTDNKVKALPYWGISPSHSVGKKLDNLLYHDSIIIGQIT